MAVIWVDDVPNFSCVVDPNRSCITGNGFSKLVDPEYYVKSEIELSRLEQTGDEEFRRQQVLKPIPAEEE